MLVLITEMALQFKVDLLKAEIFKCLVATTILLLKEEEAIMLSKVKV